MMLSSIRVLLVPLPGARVSETLQYRAFLSYSRADAGVALRVGRSLERFRFDRKRIGQSSGIGPIFCEQYDFSTRPSLGAATLAALADSAALIILASPYSAQCNYFSKQMGLFKLRHPERPVIVLIVERTPDDLEKASFLPALRFAVARDSVESPADAVPPDLYESDGFEIAIAKVVGQLTGIDSRHVCKRADRSGRPQGRTRTAVTAAVALLATASGVFWQSHQRKVAWAEAAALVERYELRSPTQAANPGARESLTQAITAIAERAAMDRRYSEALELLKAGRFTEAEAPLKAVAEDRAKRSAKDGAQAFRHLAAIAAISDPGWAREDYAEAARRDPSDIAGMFRNGWFQQEAGQFDLAEASYRRVIASATASNNEWVLWAQFGMGDLERERGRGIAFGIL
jgi:tetratricopeptide (TPR) repeat protein